MPTYLVKDPQTGKSVKLTGDSPPTEQELNDIFSGMSQQPVQADGRQELLDQLNADIGPFESAAIGIGRGITDIGRAVRLADDEDAGVKQGLAGLEEQRPITQMGGRAVGQSLPFLIPGVAAGSIASTPLRIAAGTTVGGLEGGAISAGTGESVIKGAGIGGAIAGIAEAAFPIVGRLGGALVRKLTGSTPSAVFDSAGNPTQALEQALDSSGLTLDDLNRQAQIQLTQQPANVLPEQAARSAQFEQMGITPTKAQITRDAADFQAQQEAGKTSGRVRAALEQQEGLLVNRFDEAVAGTGGNPVTSGSPVIDKVVNTSTTLDNEISDLYKVARDAAPNAKNVKMNRLGSALKANASSNKITGGLIQAIRGELQQRGIMGDKFKIIGKVDVETAEEVRKVMNSFYNSTTDFGRQKLREFKSALDDDVLTIAGEDVFNQARSAKAAFEKKLSRAKISKFDSRKSNLVRDVLENKINPDTFVNDVVNSKKWRAEDLQQLKTFSTDGGTDAVPWDDLRAEVLDSIKNMAFKGAEDAAENKALSRDGLQRALSKIGPEKLKVIFEPEELRFLRDILNVSKLREPVRGTALGKGPSAQAIKSLEDRVRNLPLMGSIIDFIDFDSAGRAVIKSNAQRTIRQRTNLEKVIPGALSVPLIASQEQQNQ